MTVDGLSISSCLCKNSKTNAGNVGKVGTGVGFSADVELVLCVLVKLEL